MTEPTCTCPKSFDDNGVLQRAYLDAACKVHARETAAHCPTCQCSYDRAQTPVVRTTELMAKLAKGEKT
jgi:hypothetical protein